MLRKTETLSSPFTGCIIIIPVRRIQIPALRPLYSRQKLPLLFLIQPFHQDPYPKIRRFRACPHKNRGFLRDCLPRPWGHCRELPVCRPLPFKLPGSARTASTCPTVSIEPPALSPACPMIRPSMARASTSTAAPAAFLITRRFIFRLPRLHLKKSSGSLKNHCFQYMLATAKIFFYIFSGASKPSTSIHVSSTSLVSAKSWIHPAFFSSSSSVRILVSW